MDDKEEKAVLVFQIADDVKEKLETIELKIHYNGTDNIFRLLKLVMISISLF